MKLIHSLNRPYINYYTLSKSNFFALLNSGMKWVNLAMSLICPHIAQPTLIGIKSSVVRKIEIVLGKKYPPKCKNVKWLFFLIKVKNEGDTMHVSVRLKENDQKNGKTKFVSN